MVIAFVVSGRQRLRAEPRGASAGAAAGRPPARCTLTLVYSPEKEKLLAPLIKRFNAEQHTSGGRVVFIDARIMASGDAETRIAQGKLRPVLWSPASSFWGRLLNYEADQRAGGRREPVDRAHAARDRDVEAARRRLRLPEAQARLRASSASSPPAAGPRSASRSSASFKYVHTNPDFSTAGLSAVAASYYAAVGKKEGLTEADVARGRAAGADARALDRALRRHDAVHRRRDAPARARLRVGRRRWRRRR